MAPPTILAGGVRPSVENWLAASRAAEVYFQSHAVGRRLPLPRRAPTLAWRGDRGDRRGSRDRIRARGGLPDAKRATATTSAAPGTNPDCAVTSHQLRGLSRDREVELLLRVRRVRKRQPVDRASSGDNARRVGCAFIR
jgi:hypothetical protein